MQLFYVWIITCSNFNIEDFFFLYQMFTNHTNYNGNNVKSRSEVHISLQTLFTDEKWYNSEFFLQFCNTIQYIWLSFYTRSVWHIDCIQLDDM